MHVSSQAAPVTRRWAHGVGLPDPAGHLSARVSDRCFPLWRGDLGPKCPCSYGVRAADPVALACAGGVTGTDTWEDENLGVSAVCAYDYSVYSPLYERSIPLLAALHPANALVLFGLNLFLIFRIRQVMQAND